MTLTDEAIARILDEADEWRAWLSLQTGAIADDVTRHRLANHLEQLARVARQLNGLPPKDTAS